MRLSIKFFFLLAIIAITSYETTAQQRVLDFSLYDRQQLGPVLMESTFFIYQPNNKNNSGTAFMLGFIYDNDSLSKRVDSVYLKYQQKTYYRYSKFKYFEILLTSAHVLENIEGEFANITLRKKKGNDYEIFDFPLQIRQNGTQLWAQIDKSVDVAAMIVALPETAVYSIIDMKYLFFKDENLDELRINAGQDISCLGFPYNTPSDNRSFPILRSGKYASFRGPHSKNDPYFLFDFRVYPGNSGGPVFVDFKSIYNEKGEQRIVSSGIIGMVSE